MMKIAVIGATGRAGSAIVAEALARGHQVVAVVRNAKKAQQLFANQVTIRQTDALAVSPADFDGCDVIVDAFATRQEATQHLDLAARLVGLYRNTESPRLAFILGASSLRQADGSLVLADVLAKNAGAAWVATPIQQAHEYTFLTWTENVNWVAVSPQFNFVPGPKTRYRVGKDEIMTNAAGQSTVTTGNLAAALIAEFETPHFVRQRFTVVDDE
ncbi:NAD(P)H-binding protein [Lacticaseibacillus nasuensis]|uniref:NAD-dependent epimerase dehydratase n=1 Tax=Lacticaseibacillus nasuensis JCM 17158 TaxID=1291734 RepID=A0A0R1JPJ7_9LACO|nr:NAD(P)H-binding protein [Lacticaseibacillus nasuensis]KRK73360.1 NAD-dependent epimerase dehydratase [Lacticaseibacillus nasuensis JCM 17158]